MPAHPSTCSPSLSGMCSSAGEPLHILFFPFMAPGHLNPMLHLAHLFSRRGVATTLLTTPANAPHLPQSPNTPVRLVLLPFPSSSVGLPDGCENVAAVNSPAMLADFFKAISMLREPFSRVINQIRPDCVVTDSFLPWTLEIASAAQIPRIVFHGTSFFSHCAFDIIHRHNLAAAAANESGSVVLPGLPRRIEIRKNQIPSVRNPSPARIEFLKEIREAEERSYGLLVNSFYDLERDYADHYRNVIGRRAWQVGPVSLSGGEITSARHECMDWLDTQSRDSVLYVCFGSLKEFGSPQLGEIARGLEASKHPFVWVVKESDYEQRNWKPTGFEERVSGMIVRGWAPQAAILSHPAIGGFLTHCGWNSCLEAVSAGVPMITWPQFAEQFLNEKLVVDVLEIGIQIGKESEEVVKAEEVEKAVARLMGGRENGRRRRARELGEVARRAVAEGGSSYVEVSNLIQELTNASRKDTTGN